MSRTREVSVTDRSLRWGSQNDSSSSRESSPRRPNKRSFSPTSDDGDLVVPPIADDDTPPPSERPMIRQPVAFAWNTSSSISSDPVSLNTYQASLPNVSALGSSSFLPGQVPIVSSQAKQGSSAKKGEKMVKKRKTTDYSGQTTRFRLSAYNSTASTEPPLQHGLGPYSAQYRATPSEHNNQYSGAASPTPTLYSFSDGGTGMSVSPNPQAPIVGEEGIINSGRAKPAEKKTPKRKAANSRAKAGKTKVSTMQHTPVYSAPSSHNRIDDLSANMIPNTNRYYRRDYESDMYSQDSEETGYLRGDDQFHDRVERTISSPLVRDSLTRHPPARPVHPNNIVTNAVQEQQPRGNSDTTGPGGRQPFRQIRMVTILIQDLRSGTTDHQLAEVKVPLKKADEEDDGFWADAKEISEKLQAGPCRIDGPAKVYTLRGKYRQFFLRVSAENVDEFISANIVIKPDRTLNVVVETLLPPGILPKPPQIPRDLQTPSPEVHELTLEELQDSRAHEGRPPSSQKHLRSGFNTREPAQRTPSTNHRSPPRSTHQRRKGKEKESYESQSPSPSQSLIYDHRPYDSPAPDQDPEEVHQLVLTAVNTLIGEEPEVTDFFRARAAPQRASEVLKQYRLVQKLIDKFVGKKPFSTSQHSIQVSHITQALKIDDPKFVSNCNETLKLLGLYGPKGRHFEDPAVLEILDDQSNPEYNAKPIKKLLHLLRNIDTAWKKRRASTSTGGSEDDSDSSPT